MNAQLELPLALPALPVKATVEERAARFDAEHPEVMEAIAEAARRQIGIGAKRLSMLHLYAEARAALKIHMNNSFMPWYTRRFIEEYPGFRGYFELRKTNEERNGKS
ncbi:MAG: hypothetical protein AMXMBFR84_37620 [Candidatus Hydrogenedentota bacterium]